jgi:hypothetical protein
MTGEGYAQAPEVAASVPWFHRLARKMTGDPNLPIPTRTPRTLERGTGAQQTTGGQGEDYRVGRAGAQQELEQERQAHPVASPLLEAGAAGAVTLPLSLAAAPTATAALMAEGGLLGGAYSSGASEAETPLQLAGDTAFGMVSGAALNPLIPGATQAVGRGLDSLRRGVGQQASRRRLGATGAYGSDVAHLMKSKGPARADQMARQMEDSGLGGIRSWQATAERAAPVVERAGQQIGDLNEAATQAGVRVNLKPVAEAIDAQAQQLRSMSSLPGVQNEADELSRTASALMQDADLSFAQAHQLRKWLDSKVWSNQKASFADPAAGAAAERYRELAGQLRGRMDAGLQDAGQGEVAQALQAANREYEAAAFALNAASKRTAREAGNQALSMQSLISGTAVGGGGVMTGNPVEGLVGGASAALASEGVKRYGNAATATGLRGAERGLSRLARTRVPTAASSPLRRGVAATAGAPSGSSMDPATVLATIDQDPEAFGQLTPQVREAALRGDVEQMNAAIQYAAR